MSQGRLPSRPPQPPEQRRLTEGWDEATGAWTPTSPVGQVLSSVANLWSEHVAVEKAGLSRAEWARWNSRGYMWVDSERDETPYADWPCRDLVRQMEAALAEVEVRAQIAWQILEPRGQHELSWSCLRDWLRDHPLSTARGGTPPRAD